MYVLTMFIIIKVTLFNLFFSVFLQIQFTQESEMNSTCKTCSKTVPNYCTRHTQTELSANE